MKTIQEKGKEMYCTTCNTEVMATLRMCPKCGNKQFSKTHVEIPVGSAFPVSSKPASTYPTTPIQSVSNTASTLAGRGERLGAAILDFLIMCACLIPAFIASSVFGSEGLAMLLLSLFILGLIIAQATFLTKKGQSLGKMIVGIRIVKISDNSLPGFAKTVLLRYMLPGFLSGIPYIGFVFWITNMLFIFRNDRRCIHDFIAETKVIVA